MTGATSFRAPWSAELKLISALAGLALAGAVGFEAFLAARGSALAAGMGTLLAAILVGAALFTVRGYAVAGDQLIVRRLLWSTRVPLAGLRSISADPALVIGSLRLFGNGGLFSFSGLFRNPRLGRYRAYVTDLDRTVVLDLGTRRIAVSPDDQERFVAALLARFPGASRRAA